MQVSFEQLPQAARTLLERALHSFSPDRATLITFSGDLGAGKTTLIKEIAHELGVSHELHSPTFVIYKKYEIVSPSRETLYPWKYLIHGDMYRIEHPQEIETLGWHELITNPENIICIEWPEHIAAVLPEHKIQVALHHHSESLRDLYLS